MFTFLRRFLQRSSDAPAVPDVTFGLRHDGIELTVGTAPRRALRPVDGVDQNRPRNCYVYGHCDAKGRFFYIGRGSGLRAWSKDRDMMWHHYVKSHLNGVYTVKILADGLADGDAEELEGQWIAQESEGLLNRQNMSRGIDLQALNRRDSLMKLSKGLMAEARAIEATDLPAAIEKYQQAFTLLKTYSTIRFEKGLYGEMEAELAAEHGPFGQIQLIDRLTLCLIKAGRAREAQDAAYEYFAIFKSNRTLTVAQSILKRLSRHAT